MSSAKGEINTHKNRCRDRVGRSSRTSFSEGSGSGSSSIMEPAHSALPLIKLRYDSSVPAPTHPYFSFPVFSSSLDSRSIASGRPINLQIDPMSFSPPPSPPTSHHSVANGCAIHRDADAEIIERHRDEEVVVGAQASRWEGNLVDVATGSCRRYQKLGR